MSATPIPQSPNDIIQTTRGYLDQQNMWILVLAGMAIGFFVLLALYIYTQYRTPKESKDIKKASNQGKMALLVVGVDHLADVMPMNDLIPEGVKESLPIGKGPTKSWLRFKLPKAERVPEDFDVEANKNREISAKVLQTLLNLNNEKVFLRNAKIPILVGVKNSVAAVSLKYLGVQTFLGKLERIRKDGTLYKQIEALKASPKFNELGLWLEDLATNVSVIDFQQVYARAASTVGQTDIDSIRERDQTIGRREGKEDKEKQTKTVLLLILGIIGVLVAGGIIIAALR